MLHAARPLLRAPLRNRHSASLLATPLPTAFTPPSRTPAPLSTRNSCHAMAFAAAPTGAPGMYDGGPKAHVAAFHCVTINKHRLLTTSC